MGWWVWAVMVWCGVVSGGEVEVVGDGIEVRGGGAGEVRVFVEGAGDGVPAVVGTVERGEGVVRFVPRFGLSAGVGYRVEVGGEVAGVVRVPEVGGEVARVVAVYPTAAVLPENLLKFYVEFSRPMGRGYAYENLTLRGDDGEVVEDPWLELGEELWDPEGKRFTLLLDPGRVKRGLKPHEEAGPVLVSGRGYQLEIGDGWKDASGKALEEGFVKTFRAAGADVVQPVPGEWEIVPPAAGTRGALVVRAPEALDVALLERVVSVRGVVGAGRVGEGEKRWWFVPESDWAAGDYVLEVGVELEDVAGNSVRKAFEVGEGEVSTGRPGAGEVVELGFRVGAGLPVSWDVGTGEGVRWKAEVVGDGASSPVVSRERVFVTSQVGSGPVASAGRGGQGSEGAEEVEFVVTCLDRADGSALWTWRATSRGRLEAVHPLQNLATPTCAVDGERVVAWFGTGQVVCLDYGGRVMWERHLGEELQEFRLRWGHSSSPVVDAGLVYLLCDHDPGAVLLVLDVRSGEEVWRAERGRGMRSYSTPVLADIDGRRQVIVNSNPGLDGYDGRTGERLWWWEEFCKVPVPVPTVVDGVMTTSRGYSNGPVMVVDLNGKRGAIGKEDVAWRWASRAPYVSSPAVSGELVYLANEGGRVTCVEAASGDVVWAEALGTCFWATPAVGGGRVYLLDESGEVLVLRDGRAAEVLSRNAMPGEGRGSPVLHGGALLVRTTAGVFCVGGE